MHQNQDYLFRDSDYSADPEKRISYVGTLNIFVEGADLNFINHQIIKLPVNHLECASQAVFYR